MCIYACAKTDQNFKLINNLHYLPNASHICECNTTNKNLTNPLERDTASKITFHFNYNTSNSISDLLTIANHALLLMCFAFLCVYKSHICLSL